MKNHLAAPYFANPDNRIPRHQPQSSSSSSDDSVSPVIKSEPESQDTQFIYEMSITDSPHTHHMTPVFGNRTKPSSRIKLAEEDEQLMRDMMTVFRVNPFAVKEPSGTRRETHHGPLVEDPVFLEFQLQKDLEELDGEPRRLSRPSSSRSDQMDRRSPIPRGLVHPDNELYSTQQNMWPQLHLPSHSAPISRPLTIRTQGLSSHRLQSPASQSYRGYSPIPMLTGLSPLNSASLSSNCWTADTGIGQNSPPSPYTSLQPSLTLHSLQNSLSLSDAVDRPVDAQDRLSSFLPLMDPTAMATTGFTRASGAPKFHECHICRKYFPRPSALVTHMNTHTGDKPYKCPLPSCHCSFAARSNMKRHLKTHRAVLDDSKGSEGYAAAHHASGYQTRRSSVDLSTVNASHFAPRTSKANSPSPDTSSSSASYTLSPMTRKIESNSTQSNFSTIQSQVPPSLISRRNASQLRSSPPYRDVFDDDSTESVFSLPLPPILPRTHHQSSMLLSLRRVRDDDERDSSRHVDEWPYHPAVWTGMPGPKPLHIPFPTQGRSQLSSA